jgi:hypothetical protein
MFKKIELRPLISGFDFALLEVRNLCVASRLPLEEQFCVFKIFEMSAIFKMAAKTLHKKWAVKIQHCPISSKFYMWVDNGVPNSFPTLKNFYRSPFSKWPPQYRKNSTVSDIIKI